MSRLRHKRTCDVSASLLLSLYLVVAMLIVPAMTIGETAASISEEERLAGYHARNYTWPPTNWVPSSLSKIMSRRIQQIQAMEDPQQRFQAYITLSSASGIVGQNLTKYGWALTRAPPHLVEQLTHELYSQQPWTSYENEEYLLAMGLLYKDKNPFMVNTDHVNRIILEELKEMHQQWVSKELQPIVAFGLRVYQNESQLLMHLDNPTTHVVSSILHVASSEDAQDWPLVLQDYEGNIVEVHMTPGDLVFYESSRILHGRPTIFNGSWYTSLFIHYLPLDYWQPNQNPMQELQFAVPPNWDTIATPSESSSEDTTLPKLSMTGTGFLEMDCGGWCGVGERIVIRGPAAGEGILESTRGATYLPRPEAYYDEDDYDEEGHDEL